MTSHNLRFALLFLVLPTTDLMSQDQSVDASLNSSWVALRDASTRWLSMDRTLEVDLLRVPKDDMLARINAAERSALRLVSARDQHYRAMQDVVKQNIQGLEVPFGASAHVFIIDMRRSVKREMEMLLSEQVDLERLIEHSSMEPGKARVRIWAERELEALKRMESNLSVETRSLDRAITDESEIDRVRKATLAIDWRLLETLEGDAFNAREDATLWKEYYQALRDLVTSHGRPNESAGKERKLWL